MGANSSDYLERATYWLEHAGAGRPEVGSARAQIAIGYTLVAILKELKVTNKRLASLIRITRWPDELPEE